jgi:hypothetical protein
VQKETAGMERDLKLSVDTPAFPASPVEHARAEAAADAERQSSKEAAAGIGSTPPSQSKEAVGGTQRGAVIYEWAAQEDTELTVAVGERLKVLSHDPSAWSEVENTSGQRGMIPGNYIELTSPGADTTPASSEAGGDGDAAETEGGAVGAGGSEAAEGVDPAPAYPVPGEERCAVMLCGLSMSVSRVVWRGVARRGVRCCETSRSRCPG